MTDEEVLELKVDALAHGGEAIGRDATGRAVFVPYAIPGERVRVAVVERHRRYARARLLEVLTPSPARVEPRCPHFGPGRCGGCHWQHIDTSIQPLLKGKIVADQLQRVGHIADPPVLEPLPDPTGWAYRNHALFRVSAEGKLGFFRSGSHHVYAVDRCPILHPLLAELFDALDVAYPALEAMELRVGTATGDRMVVFQARDEEPPLLEVELPASVVQIRHDGATAPLVGLDYITERVHGRPLRISATSFYQVNTAQAEVLVSLVLGAVDPQGGERVLDVYCGVGLFTAFLADEVGEVIGVEWHPDAVADARHNLAGADNVTIVAGPAEEVLLTLEGPFDAVVVDPPRTGVGREALAALMALAPVRFVYVSCDPATLARDARRLLDGGYHLAWVQPVDMFPQTYHIESVALFTRAEEG